MSRLISVSQTEAAVVDRRKFVTRRAGWWEDKNCRRIIQAGDYLTLCRKVMGRKPGEPLVRLCDVRVIGVRRERLDQITWHDVELEGFRWARGDLDAWGFEREPSGLPVHDGPGTIEESFIRFFLAKMGGTRDQLVTRIEWDYTDTPVTTIECSRPGQSYRLLEHGPVLDVHLAAGRGGGTGPCLCGYDRHQGGFSVGGGVTGGSVRHEPCQACERLAIHRPIKGIHAGLFGAAA